MKIGFFETLPILQQKLTKEFSRDFVGKNLILEAVREKEDYDLVLCDKNYFPASPPFRGKIYLVPGSARILSLPTEGILLTGGMNREDAVSFSSIGEESGMICLEKEIFLEGRSIFPYECKVPFDRSFSLYKNIASGFARSLITQLFTEEL